MVDKPERIYEVNDIGNSILKILYKKEFLLIIVVSEKLWFISNIKTKILNVNEHTSERTSPKISAKHIFSIFPEGRYLFNKKIVIIILAIYSKTLAIIPL